MIPPNDHTEAAGEYKYDFDAHAPLNVIAQKITAWARSKGWEDMPRGLLEDIALMHSELSEALEAYREDGPRFELIDGKPEGWGTELIDCMIRILHTCGKYGIDVEYVLAEKMRYNEQRPYRHGGKKA